MKTKLKILFVEDVPSDFELIKREIKKNGIEFVDALVETREDYKEALQSFKPDIILSDYSLPQFNGLQALEIKKEVAPTVPFILVTGALNEETAVEIMKAGADDYIIKNNFVRLDSAIKSAIGKWKEKKEKKKAELSLIESEKKFRELANLLPQVVFEIDVKGNLSYINEQGLELFGFQEEDIKNGLNVIERIAPEDRERVRNRIQEVLSGSKNVSNHEYVALKKDGSRFPVLIYSSVILKENVPIGLRGVIVDITKRKQAQDDLEASEKQYRRFFEKDISGIYLSTPQGKLLDCNPAFADMLGYSIPEIIELNTSALYPNPTIRSEFLHKLTANKNLVNSEIKLVRKDGQIINCVENVVGIFNQEGKLIEFQGYVADITKRKQAEEKIRKLSQAVEQSPASIIITNLKGDIEYINPKFTELTGYSLAETLGKTPRILKSDETPPEVYKELWKTISSGNEWRGELHNKRKNGELFWEFASISAIRNMEGKITHYLGVKEDITERKQAEEQLRQSEEKYRNLIETTSEGFWLLDEDNITVDVNESLCKMLGYSKKQIIGKKPHNFVDWMNNKIFEDQTLKSQTSKHRTYEVSMRKKNGDTFPTIFNATTIFDDEEKQVGSFAFITDITERKLAEEAIKRSEKQLRELTKYMDAKFEEERKRIGGEIHDGIGQLLTSIIMDLQWIEKKWPEESGKAKDKFNSMISTINRGVKEVQQLAIQLRPEMLDKLGLLETIRSETEMFDEKTGIYCDVQFKPEQFEVDKERTSTIYRVLMELLTNTYRYADATKIAITLERKESEYVFSFIDNGVGITQEQIESKSSFGLMSISERVNKWNGTFDISGEPNKGTSVQITIPY